MSTTRAFVNKLTLLCRSNLSVDAGKIVNWFIERCNKVAQVVFLSTEFFSICITAAGIKSKLFFSGASIIKLIIEP